MSGRIDPMDLAVAAATQLLALVEGYVNADKAQTQRAERAESRVKELEVENERLRSELEDAQQSALALADDLANGPMPGSFCRVCGSRDHQECGDS